MTDILGRIQALEQTVRTLAVRMQHAVKPTRQVETSSQDKTIAGAKMKSNSRELRELVIMQNYGFASATLPGCDHVTVQIAGDSSNGFSIATNDQNFRPKNMTGGSVMVYDNSGNSILLANGQITITAPTGITIQTPTTHYTGNVTVDGDVTAGTVSLRHHTHGGIKSGGENSGQPNT